MEATSFSVMKKSPDAIEQYKNLAFIGINVAMDTLAALDSYSSIEAYLLEREINGAPGCVSHCVIANYLLREVPSLVWLEIDNVKREIVAAVVINGRTETIHTTVSPFLAGFIDGFDLSAFPTLVGAECGCALFLADC